LAALPADSLVKRHTYNGMHALVSPCLFCYDSAPASKTTIALNPGAYYGTNAVASIPASNQSVCTLLNGQYS